MLTLKNLEAYVESLLGSGGDLAAFAPELWLCATVVAMLLIRTVFAAHTHMSMTALVGSVLALWSATGQWNAGVAEAPTREIFQGMLVYDMFTVYMRVFLLTFLVLEIVLCMLTGIPDAEDSADFFTLLVGSVIGMSMMTAANHVLMIFIAVEMASVPSYALAGFLKGRRQSSEAALKYVVYGGAASGVMLYGLSLLAGRFGSMHIPTLAQRLIHEVSAGGGFDVTLLVALVLVLVGLAFKLSAFPFHFWCPDVFEGAAAEVAAFLSVASKGAAVALVARFTLALAGTFAWAVPYGPAGAATAAMLKYLSPTLAVIAAVTATFGNLAAYGQTNLKRLLAYSTIAHAGYMLMALVPLTTTGAKAALFYAFVYLFMNLGAFAVVAFVRNQTGSEELSSYTGLVYRAPWLAITMSVFLLSLVGMPPLAGFVGKFQIFYVLYEEGWYTLLGIGCLNTVISLVYYVNVLRIMIIRGEPTTVETPWEGWFAKGYAALIAVPVLWFGIFWSGLDDWATVGAKALEPGGRPIAEIPGDLPKLAQNTHR